ncbi:putative F-box protein At1g50870 [Triticum dicoccoides]|uniref:putative F-box protein At1g50870 n=1 Tax=Triticum dicoccoides TaxID=85692 RepID=UPI0018919513|nr:putative F-box protein At1g50870 [Triticum dicoccoides]XP_044432663.1 putative F-box protein At1g50870 [Triticum aestivum]
MPDKRGATLLEDLPEEIIDKILIRLQPKDVGRCRAVCPLWRSVSSTPEFMVEHHRRQPSLPVINGLGRPASLVILRNIGAGVPSQQLWPFVSGQQNWYENYLQGAHGGFLIVSRRSRFYVCNPVLRKHALLPQPRFGQGIHNSIIGFYQHHPTREYRVLWVSELQHSSDSSLYILTLGSDEPRHVRIGMLSMDQKLLKGLKPPVHHRGSLHWYPYYYDASKIVEIGKEIIAFHTEVESFRLLGSPPQPYRYRGLFKMNETLAFWGGSTPHFTTMDIWVMQDYEAEVWALKYQIDVSTVEASRQLYRASSKKKKKTPLDSVVQWFNCMVVLNDRELLILFNDKHVLRCDVDGKFLGIVNIGKSQYCMFPTWHRVQESIIPIPCHGMQEEDEEPPFS